MDRKLVSVLRSVTVVATVGAFAAGCGQSGSGFSDPIEDALGDPMVALGLRVDPNEEEIEYGPRSPLVMPAETAAADLPTPYDPVETYGVNWPDDPDERAKREYAAMKKAAAEAEPEDFDEYSYVMSPQELNEWGRMYGRQNGAGFGSSTADGREVDKVVDPRELLDRRKNDTELLRSEPARVELTDPPAGYRTPAPPVDGSELPEEKKKGLFGRLFNRS